MTGGQRNGSRLRARMDRRIPQLLSPGAIYSCFALSGSRSARSAPLPEGEILGIPIAAV
jgi:hypothetical protein